MRRHSTSAIEDLNVKVNQLEVISEDPVQTGGHQRINLNSSPVDDDVRALQRPRRSSLNKARDWLINQRPLTDMFKSAKLSRKLGECSTMDDADIETRSHDNKNFKKFTENHHFHSSFGKKGSDIGEFQDAKNIITMPEDRLMITDFINSRIQICNNSGKGMLVYSGDDVMQPWCSVLNKDQFVMFTSYIERCVVVLKPDGTKVFDFGRNMFQRPTGLAIDSKDRVIVADAVSNRVSMHEPDGTPIRYLGDTNDEKQSLSKPQYVCVSSTSDILVADSGNHCIKIYNSNGDFVKSFGGFGKIDGRFKSPHGICTSKVGEIFVADHYNSRVSAFTRYGIFLRHIVTSEDGLQHPKGVAMDTDDHLHVTHGHLKASEVVTFKLSKAQSVSHISVITHL